MCVEVGYLNLFLSAFLTLHLITRCTRLTMLAYICKGKTVTYDHFENFRFIHLFRFPRNIL